MHTKFCYAHRCTRGEREFAHSSPLKVFAALTNMYSRFDSKTLHAVTDRDEEGRQKDHRQGCKLSKTFGRTLGDIGLCMTYFEEGRAVSFGELLDRYESETIASSFNPNSVERQRK